MSDKFTLFDYLAIGIYLAILIVIGIRFSRRQKDTTEYFLGGHRIGWFAAGVSYLMTLFSTISIVQTPGEVFKHGVSMLIPGLVVYPVCLLLTLFFLRIYFERGYFTPFEYLQSRFDKRLRLFVSILYFWTRLLYVGMVLFACVTIFRTIAGWPPSLTLLIVGGAVTFYTVLGGMRAVIWTDVIQAVVLFSGLGLTLWFIVRAIPGGVPEIFRYSLSQGKGPDLFATASFYELKPFVRLSFWIITFQLAMEAIFSNSADQISIQRLLSTSSYANVRKAMLSNVFSSLPLVFTLIVIGFGCFTYYSLVEPEVAPNPDAALFQFVGDKLPSPLPGLIMAAMLAAAMSTLSGALNSLATVSLKDFYLVFHSGRTFSETHLVKVSRQMTVGIALLGTLLAAGLTLSSEALRETMIEANAIWSFLGVVIAPIFIFGMFSKTISSRQIWQAIALSWGVNAAMALWYVGSKNGYHPAGLLDLLGWKAVGALTVALVASGWMRAGRLRFTFALNLLRGLLLGGIVWLGSSLRYGPGELSFQWVTWPGQLVFLLAGGWFLLCSKGDAKGRATPPLEREESQSSAAQSSGGSSVAPAPDGARGCARC